MNILDTSFAKSQEAVPAMVETDSLLGTPSRGRHHHQERLSQRNCWPKTSASRADEMNKSRNYNNWNTCFTTIGLRYCQFLLNNQWSKGSGVGIDANENRFLQRRNVSICHQFGRFELDLLRRRFWTIWIWPRIECKGGHTGEWWNI